MSLPAPHQVDRFRADLLALTVTVPAKIGIAVSGGPDSLALLFLAHTAFPGQVYAATVDHGLRPESHAEASFVAEISQQISVPHTILSVNVPPGGEGLQGEARRARYAALADWAARSGITVLCTGHHLDDQAETILMRLQRGSGVGGLAGIRTRRNQGPDLMLVRPLLDWTREELAQVVQGCGVTAVDDPSNRDTRFDRVAMRQFLSAKPQFEPRRLARSATSAAEADHALEWITDRLEGERCDKADGEWRIDTKGLPRELTRRLLCRAIAAIRREHGLSPPWTGAEDVENLLQMLEKGGTATRAGTIASAKGSTWRVRAAPPRRGKEKPSDR